MFRRLLAPLMFGVAVAALTVQAQPAPVTKSAAPTPPAVTPSAADLAAKQILEKQDQLRRQYAAVAEELLTLAHRLEKSSRVEDKEKANLIRRALELGDKENIENKFQKLLQTLAGKNGAVQLIDVSVAKNQNEELVRVLKEILAILMSDDEMARLRAEKDFLEKRLAELKAIIRETKVGRAINESGKGDPKKLAKDQDNLKDKTDNLAKRLEGKDPNAKEGPMGKDGMGPMGKDGMGEPKDGKGPMGKDGMGEPKDGKGGKDGMGEPKDGKGGKGGEGEPKDGKGGKGGEGEPKDGKGGKGGEGEPKDGKGGKGGMGEPKDGKGGKGGEGEPKDGKGGKGGMGEPKDGKGGKGGMGEPKDGMGDPKGGMGDPMEQLPMPPQQAQKSPGADQVRKAVPDQEQAKKDLEQNKRPDAVQKQTDAIQKLEEAQKELEKRLKQLREEELERLLANLEARVAKMLQMQIDVYEATKSIDAIVQKNELKKPDKPEVQKSQVQADKETEIIAEANKTIDILKSEGSAVAFPRVFEETVIDMTRVRERLNQANVAIDTQLMEKDIIDSLKEMLEALKKAQQDLQQSKGMPPPGGGGGGPPPEQKLLDEIAELKMLRNLQVKVNERTTRHGAKLEGAEQTTDPQVKVELKDLSNRQVRIEEMARDIATGKNK